MRDRNPLICGEEPASGSPGNRKSIATTTSRAITLTGMASASRASASTQPGDEVGRGPSGMPDGTFHGRKPSRTFAVR